MGCTTKQAAANVARDWSRQPGEAMNDSFVAFLSVLDQFPMSATVLEVRSALVSSMEYFEDHRIPSKAPVVDPPDEHYEVWADGEYVDKACTPEGARLLSGRCLRNGAKVVETYAVTQRTEHIRLSTHQA